MLCDYRHGYRQGCETKWEGLVTTCRTHDHQMSHTCSACSSVKNLKKGTPYASHVACN